MDQGRIARIALRALELLLGGWPEVPKLSGIPRFARQSFRPRVAELELLDLDFRPWEQFAVGMGFTFHYLGSPFVHGSLDGFPLTISPGRGWR